MVSLFRFSYFCLDMSGIKRYVLKIVLRILDVLVNTTDRYGMT